MRFVLVLLAFLALIILLGAAFPTRGGESLLQPGLVSAIAIGTVAGAGVLYAYQGRLSQGVQHAGIWIGLFFLIVLGYSFRGEITSVLGRVSSELNPAGGAVGAAGTVTIAKGFGQHFEVEGRVGATPVLFLVDTGASLVVLTEGDAARIGIDVAALAFVAPFQTANGEALGALIRLPALEVGPIRIENVPAAVMRAGQLEQSLLGMSFLGRLQSYAVTGDTLTLQAKPR